MKRDMDLVREILLKVDASEAGVDLNELVDEDSEAALRRVDYHVRMLVEQTGLLTGEDASTLSGPGWIDLELTWHGHEFLDQIRDPEIWRAAKAGVQKAGGFSLDLISALAKGLIKTQIEKHTGLSLDL